MNSHAILSLVTCALGAAVLAGCASPPSSPAQASAPVTIQGGKVIAMQSLDSSAGATSGASAGASASGTSATRDATGRIFEPATVTVQFADGTQSMYTVEKHERNYFKLGDPVRVVTDRDSMVILAP